MFRLVVGVFVAVVVVGCKSRPFGPYVSPRITGQVFAADNGKPLKGVKVMRLTSETGASKTPPLKGGEQMILKVPIQTGEDGRFVLSSEKVLSIIRAADWNVVSLAFNRPGYLPFQTNCLIESATNAMPRSPTVDLGHIFLRPKNHFRESSSHQNVTRFMQFLVRSSS
jgi:hypothetical protein